jgi:hypothetical protein
VCASASTRRGRRRGACTIRHTFLDYVDGLMLRGMNAANVCLLAIAAGKLSFTLRARPLLTSIAADGCR